MKNKKMYIILSLVLLFSVLYFFYYLSLVLPYSFNIRAWISLIYPFSQIVISIILIIFYNKKKISSSLCLAFIPVGIYVSIVTFFLGAIFITVPFSFEPIEDVNLYSSFINKNVEKREVALQHFPVKLTDNMHDIQFVWREAFMQGGANRELKYKVTDAAVLDNIIKKYEINALKVFYSDEYCIYCDDEGKDIVNESLYHLPNFYYDYDIDEEYDTIIIINNTDGGNYWNHGDSYGILVNHHTLEIIYWYHYW